MARWQFIAVLLVFGFYFSLGRQQRLPDDIDRNNLERDGGRKDFSSERLYRNEDRLRQSQNRNDRSDWRLNSRREVNDNRLREFDERQDRIIAATRRLAYEDERNQDINTGRRSVYREEIHRDGSSARRQNQRLVNQRNLQNSRELREYRTDYMARRESVDESRMRNDKDIRERLAGSRRLERIRQTRMLENERNQLANRQNEERRIQKSYIDLADFNNTAKDSIFMQQPFLTVIQCSVLAFVLMKALQSKDKLKSSGKEEMYTTVQTLLK